MSTAGKTNDSFGSNGYYNYNANYNQYGGQTGVPYGQPPPAVVMQPMAIQQPQYEPSQVENAAKKVARLALVGAILGFLTMVAGAATLGVAAENIGFPVFNFGPLLTGIIFFFGYAAAYWRMRSVLTRTFTSDTLLNEKCPLVTMFVMSVVCVTFATLSGIFALLSGITCAGSEIAWYRKYNGYRERLDTRQYCFPNDKANTALAFVDTFLCLLIGICSIVGCVFFCVYGRYFGVRNRRHAFAVY